MKGRKKSVFEHGKLYKSTVMRLFQSHLEGQVPISLCYMTTLCPKLNYDSPSQDLSQDKIEIQEFVTTVLVDHRQLKLTQTEETI